MAPPYKNRGVKNDRWWDDAYATHPDIDVEYIYIHGKDVIEPGDKIKIKRKQGTYAFRCLAHNITLDVRWIDCKDTLTGEWKSFRTDELKGKVKPRRRRRKKNEAIQA
jgi:hypothetical protein